MTDMKQTTLRKSITRKINTGNFSNIDITCDIQQEVSWESGKIDQLLQKSEALTKLLLVDFKKSQDEVMSDVFGNDRASQIMDANNPQPKALAGDFDSI